MFTIIYILQQFSEIFKHFLELIRLQTFGTNFDNSHLTQSKK